MSPGAMERASEDETSGRDILRFFIDRSYEPNVPAVL
jgi:hypothetical protein